MSLNGLGTESNPFLVSTWDQFKEALEYEDSEKFNENSLKYVSLQNDIDITTEKKGWMGKEEQVNITNYVKIIGNNHTIRSLPILDTFLFYKFSNADYIYFYDINIENFYILAQHLNSGLFSFGTFGTSDSTQGINFYNCSFSGILDGLHQYTGLVSPGYNSINKTTFNNCNFNLFLKDRATFYGALAHSAQYIHMTNCNIYLQGNPYVDSRGIFSTSGDLTTSQIRGNITPKGRISNYSDNFLMYIGSGQGAYNVIDLVTNSSDRISISDSSTIVNNHNAPNIKIAGISPDYLFDFTNPAGDDSMTLEDKLIELNFLYGVE